MIEVDELEALEQVRAKFRVLCHRFPLDASVDGVLGLDFFRGHRLTIDLRDGFLSID